MRYKEYYLSWLPIEKKPGFQTLAVTLPIYLVTTAIASGIAAIFYGNITTTIKENLKSQLSENQINNVDFDSISKIFDKWAKKHGNCLDAKSDTQKIIQAITPEGFNGVVTNDRAKSIKKELKATFNDSKYLVGWIIETGIILGMIGMNSAIFPQFNMNYLPVFDFSKSLMIFAASSLLSAVHSFDYSNSIKKENINGLNKVITETAKDLYKNAEIAREANLRNL